MLKKTKLSTIAPTPPSGGRGAVGKQISQKQRNITPTGGMEKESY